MRRGGLWLCSPRRALPLSTLRLRLAMLLLLLLGAGLLPRCRDGDERVRERRVVVVDDVLFRSAEAAGGSTMWIITRSIELY